MAGRIRAFLAASLDGRIAGANDDLSWLPGHTDAGIEDTFTPFFREIGAVLMGRRTYEVVRGFGGAWPYGEVPMLIATQRPFVVERPSVRAVTGGIEDLLTEALRAAGGRDVYVDGGALVRSVMAAGRLQELTLTVVPVVLGAGVPLFGDGVRTRAQLASVREIGAGLVQLRYTFPA